MGSSSKPVHRMAISRTRPFLKRRSCGNERANRITNAVVFSALSSRKIQAHEDLHQPEALSIDSQNRARAFDRVAHRIGRNEQSRANALIFLAMVTDEPPNPYA